MLVLSLLLSLNYLVTGVVSSAVCDECVCLFNVSANEDYAGERVDCSYKNQGILKAELPAIVSTLDLSSSNLSRIQSSNLLRSKTLAELNLSNNVITEIEINALALPGLKKLALNNNLLTHIDKEAFNKLSKLEYLNLANNRFTTLADIKFHRLTNLNDIILDYNNLGPSLSEISLFDRNGAGLTPKIKRLSIRAINLNEVPDNLFVDVYDIRSLVISGNNITDVFELPMTLEYLDLSDNPIEEICEEDFTDAPGLRQLQLNNLAIKEVPDYAFAALRGLTTLGLERNKNLTWFSRLAFGQDVLEDADDFILERLSLSGSRLSSLDKDLETPFGQLFQLDLQGNPWTCDCNILWMKKLQISPEDYEHVRCSLPLQLYNSRIFELKNKYFKCQTPRNRIGLMIAVFTFCITSTAILVWVFFFMPRKNIRLPIYNPYNQYTMLKLPNTP